MAELALQLRKTIWIIISQKWVRLILTVELTNNSNNVNSKIRDNGFF